MHVHTEQTEQRKKKELEIKFQLDGERGNERRHERVFMVARQHRRNNGRLLSVARGRHRFLFLRSAVTRNPPDCGPVATVTGTVLCNSSPPRSCTCTFCRSAAQCDAKMKVSES